ncbi:hypothetical protein, partial [Limosilactobacillus reuteri]|uniref:hypothetical protein n=1 Tax=Limosilactobacillus reuteri TaxID=1598 RepID=UPI001CDBFA8D
MESGNQADMIPPVSIVRNDIKLHIHHPSLVFRLGFLYYVIGDVYEVYKRKLVELVSKIIDNCYLVRAT